MEYDSPLFTCHGVGAFLDSHVITARRYVIAAAKELGCVFLQRGAQRQEKQLKIGSSGVE
jgi:hypothetical protein